jgi:hypothetical protein
VDAVIGTLVLCSVNDVDATLRGKSCAYIYFSNN